MISRDTTLLISSLLGLATLTACGSSSDDTSQSAESTSPVSSDSATASSETSTDETPASTGDISIEQLADLICDTAPERMGGDAEMFTETSWMCSFGEDRVRIDTYEDDGQMEQARAATADFYASTDPSKTLADFPFVCGNLWTAGFDYNETRDIAIGLLIEAGINAGTC